MDRRAFLSTISTMAAVGALTGKTTRPPNVVFIYCDDLGYGDLGCYGSTNRTPHIDRLGAEGARFTQFYSANPVCSPSRAALLTGRYPTRVGVPRVLFPTDTVGLQDGEVTIAQMLKAKEYKTMCVGKWHLGHLPHYLPTNRGFDEYYGIPYSNDMKPRVLLHAAGGKAEVVEEEAALESLTERYTGAGDAVYRERETAAFLPLHAAHVPAYSAGGLSALSGEISQRTVRRRDRRNRLERGRGDGGDQARRARR
jgi:arylsulfatase